ncbi:hypothetical protein C2G38_541813 [Gigaspora rosea]|uniref:G-protein coupled receptors family 1 profile domain-containing protein n=1 Tax=Gigaspora rosea TaxID=44941 RepID=A0A397U8P2_9GLOM|nr:hypothetical protein C2G38_541813 [Gigaspora rosea]
MHLFSSITRISLLAVQIILLLFSIKPNVVIAQTQVVVTFNRQYEFDDYQNDIVAVIAITFGNINLCACLYVLYSAFIRWRASSLSLSTRIPLYFGILEVCQYIVFMPNFIYSLINNQLISGLCCKSIAYLLFLQITINMILMASIAMTTYLRIVKGKNIYLGTYDWKLFVFIFLSSIIVTIPSIQALGPSRFWCMTMSREINELLIDGFTIFCVTFTITCFCYFQTLSTIFNIDRDGMTDCKERMDRWNRLERKATRKILLYIVSFMIRWLLLIPYGVGVMSGYDYIWMHITAVVAFNMGGITMLILYLMNEGLKDRNLRPISGQIHTTITSKMEHLSAFSASALNGSPKSITVPMAVFIPYNSNNPTFNCDSIYVMNSLDNDNYDGIHYEKQQQHNGVMQNKSPSDDDSFTQTDISDIEDELYLSLRC